MLTPRYAKLLAVGMAGVLLAAACGSSPSRQDVLDQLADEVIIPAYEDFLGASTALAEAVADLCPVAAAAGNTAADQIAIAQDALKAARASWSFSEAMWVGPVMLRRSRAVVDWEIDAEQIDARVADTSFALTAENLSTRVGADERGLSAAEYILANTETALSKLATPRYCEYLQAITQVIASEAQLLESDWTVSFRDGPPYREIFVDGSDLAGIGLDDVGLDAIVNNSLNLLSKINEMELRKALDGDLDALQESQFGMGADHILQHLAGVRAALIGGGGTKGLSELLGGDITSRLTSRLDAADASVAALDAPLRTSVRENPASVESAYEAIRAARVTVATEVVSTLGVAISFSDTDGDSAG